MRAIGRFTASCLMIMSLWGCAATPSVPEPPRPVSGGVRFAVLVPGVRTVALAGSFNGWSATAHPMRADGDGRWALVLPLPPGEHLFMYVVDGKQWLTPPLAEDFVEDGFGSRNGVVTVR